MKKDIRNHPYHFEQALQRRTGLQVAIPSPTIETMNGTGIHEQPKQQVKTAKSTTYFTWLVFMYAKWVPFDANNQSKLEQTLHLGGTFVDIEDSNFPKVKRVRVFPKSNYLSYLGVKYRLSRVMQPDAWSDSHDMPTSAPPPTSSQLQLPQDFTFTLPAPGSLSSDVTNSNNTTSESHTRMDYWESTTHRSSQTLISHVLS